MRRDKNRLYQNQRRDLKKYKTYAWGRPGDPDHNYNHVAARRENKMYAGLILKLANEELLKKGFVLDRYNQVPFLFSTLVQRRAFHTVRVMLIRVMDMAAWVNAVVVIILL